MDWKLYINYLETKNKGGALGGPCMFMVMASRVFPFQYGAGLAWIYVNFVHLAIDDFELIVSDLWTAAHQKN